MAEERPDVGASPVSAGDAASALGRLRESGKEKQSKQVKKDLARVLNLKKEPKSKQLREATSVATGERAPEAASGESQELAIGLTRLLPGLIAGAVGGAEAGALAAGAGEQQATQLQADITAKEAAEAQAKKEAQARADQERAFALKEKQLQFQQQIAQAKTSEEATRAQAKVANDLRKERNALTTTKDTQQVSSAFEKVRVAAEDPSAAGDLALIFNYMKMLDPGSVVREGEFANAQNAAGVPDRVRNQWNRLVDGERLNDDQRRDFINQAGNVFSAQQNVQNQIDDQFSELATNAGVDPSQVIISFETPTTQEFISQREQQGFGGPGVGLPGVSEAQAADPRVEELAGELSRRFGLQPAQARSIARKRLGL